MPGVWVFPGGAVDDADGRGRRRATDETPPRLRRARARRGGRDRAAADAELVPWSRWITPEVVPIRFDTRFFLALAPPTPRPSPTASRSSTPRWFEPARALDLPSRGRAPARLPDDQAPRVAARPTRTPTRRSTRPGARASSRSCRGWSAKGERRGSCSGRARADDAPRQPSRGVYSRTMTAACPQRSATSSSASSPREYTTVDARQQPITWPVTPYYADGAADDRRHHRPRLPEEGRRRARNPQVALLFSDPTGSGIESGIRVLVQGTAEVDDRDLDANRERYWRESPEKLPGDEGHAPAEAPRGMFGWYYARIYVKVRPERVFVWPDGDLAARARRSTTPTSRRCARATARSRSSRTRPPRAAPTPGTSASSELGERYDDRRARLGRRRTASRSSARLPVAARPRRAGRSRSAPARRAAAARGPRLPDRPLARARLHLAGELPGPRRPRPRRRGWALVPHRLIGGFELPDEGPLARYAPQPHEVAALLPHGAQAALKAARLSRSGGGGNGSSPACQGPAG